jgi:hypothetical protein
MTPLSERLPRLNNPNSSMWIDEAIWGHRLYDEQSPWLVYMEFLNILAHEIEKDRAFEESEYNSLKYNPYKRLSLRNILFNNPRIEHILTESQNDSDRWRIWFDEMRKNPNGQTNDFGYLKNHFHSFEDFCHIVSILQSTSLEMNSNKRWTSKFVFPYGMDCLYEDLDKKGKTNDRRFFGRTGEILYLMLCRSQKKEALLSALKKKVLNSEISYWNKIVKCLQPQGKDLDRSLRANSFLPYIHHHCYDDLAEDWLNILNLDIPGYDMLPFIVNLSGFHIIKYLLEVSNQILMSNNQVSMVCEIVAPKKTLVREISWILYQKNNALPLQAVEKYISGIKGSQEWEQAVGGNDPFIKCFELLQKKVVWPKDNSYDGPNIPEDLIGDLKAAAIKRHRQHVGNVHRVYGKEIGLVSKRSTNKLRYAPNDNFLKTIIFANVPKRMELNHFLDHIGSRYGLIFGGKQAEQILASNDFDKKAFQANSQRLEQRLFSLGLLRRLSDGCAYIINPYFPR